MGRHRSVKEKPSAPDPLVDSPPTSKRRTGRKSNAQKQQEAADEQKRIRDQWEAGAKTLAPVLEGVVPIPFNIIAKKRGEHWLLKSEEVKNISHALAIIIEKHMPDFMFAWQEEIMLCVFLGGAIAGRVAIDQKHAEEQKAKKVESEDVSTGDHGNAPHGQDNIDAALAQGK